MVIDFSKYDRLFTFGCSFTKYGYPTWADLVHKSMPDAKYYNFGQSGAGNIKITSRITEANRTFKFSETDLVMVMWSTFCREDRYSRAEGWITPGNIYTQDTYKFMDTPYFKRFGDPLNYLIRDTAIIDVGTEYLKTLSCDIVPMLSVPFNYQQSNIDTVVESVLSLYRDLENWYLTSLFELELKKGWKETLRGDYHPSPLQYFQYLTKLGMVLSKESKMYAEHSSVKLKVVKDAAQELPILFPECNECIYNSSHLICVRDDIK